MTVARRALLAVAVTVGLACSRGEPGGGADPPAGDDPGDPGDPTLTSGDGSASSAARPRRGHPATVRRVEVVPPGLARLVRLERVVNGLDHPLALEVAPGDRSGRLFVVERGGRVLLLRGGTVSPAPFLDLGSLVSRDHEERGLLGLAFHPDYARSGRFFVNYTDRSGDTRVVEYRVSRADPDRADPASARLLFHLDQPYANHNGGGLEFGPDGMLWIGTGDGGSAGDPLRAGQDRKKLLAKMLRIDVGARSPAPEVVMIGLRNPWRYWFDTTGDLYIGDVGQDAWEEIDVVARADLVGANLGWSEAEGDHCYRGRRCNLDRFVPPAVEYHHRAGCSVTGGEVYRGRALPELVGVYFYADYCTALVRSFRWTRQGGATEHRDWKPVLDPGYRLSTLASFGHDAAGELYLVSLDGAIFKLVRAGAAR